MKRVRLALGRSGVGGRFLAVFVVVVVVVFVVAVVVSAVVALFLVYLFVRVPFLVGLLWLRVPLLLCGVPLLPYSVSVHP